MRRIVAACSWFDEPEDQLREMVLSLEGIVDHLVCLDGAYKHFPHDFPTSPMSQHDAIAEAAKDAGITVTVLAGREFGNQMEKRTELLRAACEHGMLYQDYILLMDADEVVTDVDMNLVHEFMDAGIDTVDVTLDTMPPADKSAERGLLGIQPSTASTWHSGRGRARIFRMLKDMTVGPVHHWTYTGIDENGSLLSIKGHGNKMIRRAKRGTIGNGVKAMRIQNNTWQRSSDRIAAKNDYGLIRLQLQEDL